MAWVLFSGHSDASCKKSLDLHSLSFYMQKYLYLLLFVAVFVSCKEKKDKLYIPRKDFVAILADMHLADAYYSSHFEQSKLHNDSLNFYNRILGNYGYTKAQFDTTMKYYSIHSDKFDLVYEDVITLLNKTEPDIYQNRPSDMQDTVNIWHGKNSWYLPAEGEHKRIPVDLKLKGKGKYEINFTYKVYPDDQSKNLRTDLYFASDSGAKPKKDTLKTIRYEKGGRTSVVTITKELKDSTLTHLKGYLLDHDQRTGQWKMHVVIEGLKVYYHPQQ
jgi:hypothetical protein